MQRIRRMALTTLLASCWVLCPQLACAQSPGPASSGQRGISNNVGTGTGDIPGSSTGLPEIKSGALKGAYGLDLSQRIAQAQALVDQVNRGRVLTDSDTRRIRNLMREDFAAWNRRFDLLPSNFRAERDRWLVDAQALSPSGWAVQRLKWLEAQRDWVLAHGG